MGMLMFLGVLFLIVLLHEFGHLIVAKRYGVKVPTYSIGFGPSIVGVKYFKGKFSFKFLNGKPTKPITWALAETEYRLSLFPFGGYCKLQGEMDDSGKPDGRDLVSKPFFQKTMIALAGVIINLVTGFLAVFGVAVNQIGLQKAFQGTINAVTNIVILTFDNLYSLIVGTGGRLMTWTELNEMSAQITTAEIFWWYFGILSIVMAFFNMIPFPALDGSLPFLWGLEKVFGKRNGRMLANSLATIGFIILMALQLWIVLYWIMG